MPSLSPALSPTPAARRSILMMVGAMACFVTNDALSKFASQSLPAAQLIFLRSVVVGTLLLWLMHRQGGLRPWHDLRAALQGRVLWRSAADACGTAMYLFSLFHLPLANAAAITLAAPLFMALFALCFLGERASLARVLGVTLGFVGVLAVVQPTGSGFNAWALLCVAGTLLQSVRDLLTRAIGSAVPTLVIALSSATALGLLSGGLSIWQGWQPVHATEAGLIVLAALFLAAAYLLLIGCLRLGEISLTAPFRYSAILFAVLLGWAIWGQAPNRLAWCGITLLVGAGWLVMRAEHRSRQSS